MQPDWPPAPPSGPDWARAIGHDLRAPLRHITSYAGLLADALADHVAGAPMDPEAPAWLQAQQAAARELGERITALQHLLQVQASALQAEVLLADALCALLHEAAAAAASRLQVHAPADSTPAQACVDPAALRDALAVLVANALRFSPADAPPAALQSHGLVTPPPGRAMPPMWHITLRDHGVGLPAGVQPQGDVFVRFHAPRTPAGEPCTSGVGAGLARLALRCQRHGAVWQLANAEDGRGCVATLWWPVQLSN